MASSHWNARELCSSSAPVLDFANVPNVSTTFLVYKNWKDRTKGLTQDRIVSSLNRELAGIQEALAFVVIPPPIRGLGQTGGFQMMVEDRRSLGLTELSRNTSELIQKGNSNPGLRGLATTFSTRSPQVYLNIDRTKAESLQVLPSSIFDTLQAYLGSSFVSFFNKFNQVFRSTSRPRRPIVCSPTTCDTSTPETRTERWSR